MLKANGDPDGAEEVDEFVDSARGHLMEFATRSWIDNAPALVAGITSDLLVLQPGETLGGALLEDARDPDVPLDSRSPSASNSRPRLASRSPSPPSASAPIVPAVPIISSIVSPVTDSTASAPPQPPSESLLDGLPRKRPLTAPKLTPEVVVPAVRHKRLKTVEVSSIFKHSPIR